LRKADLEIEITKFEWNWLLKQELLETIESIKQEPQRKAEEPRKLDAEFSQLKSKFKVTRHRDLRLSSPLYPILWKLDSENQLTDLEVKYLQEQGLTETVAIVQEMAGFAALKAKYQATQYPDSSLDSPLYQILKQLDAGERLSDVETNWLLNNQLVDTL
jgi:predicted nuclease with TOPRIM domain